MPGSEIALVLKTIEDGNAMLNKRMDSQHEEHLQTNKRLDSLETLMVKMVKVEEQQIAHRREVDLIIEPLKKDVEEVKGAKEECKKDVEELKTWKQKVGPTIDFLNNGYTKITTVLSGLGLLYLGIGDKVPTLPL